MLTEKKLIAIVGFGREGVAILKFVKAQKEFKKHEIWILDKSTKIKLPRGTKGQFGENYLENLERFEYIFRSPGFHFLNPALQKAIKKGSKVSSATKLFFDYAKKKHPAKIIGVTGTKGKGTTSTLIYKILKAAGKKVFLAGNIGTPALNILNKIDRKTYVILELSSFQLQDLHTSPDVAVVLEIFPDHQDAHKNLKEYFAAKANVVRHQKNADQVFFFGDQKQSRATGLLGLGKKNPVLPQDFNMFDPEELTLRGSHNYRNAVMATLVALSLKIPKSKIIKTVKKFTGLEHRMELVCSSGNVAFYNDSASTNPHTTVAALKSFPGKKTALICGGVDKGLDYSPLKKELSALKKKSEIELVVLIGENKNKILTSIKDTGVEIKNAETLEESIKLSVDSLSKTNKDSVVLFSPGAASFDMFLNYADRGEKFRRIAKGMIKN
jgi:UDP-N-acetylmuramoylalanine--D-glutamate ligase